MLHLVLLNKIYIFVTMSKNTRTWTGHFPEQLSNKVWAYMKKLGLTNESQFMQMMAKYYLDNHDKKDGERK